ncbi:hypothetical protein J31TS6_54320 [Brevibacillus reuszeri]|uniref:hypothetical protein n=1 Tax=Brevibacillus reuszeri TaxID=54915 RepID=UPI001B09BCD9|nr:hypothetical protein [Brevibacillus reuszeri]GIO09404.1 hypothetical protein J31TS6_54320 [Brevibacillus reuszeri]
MAQQVAKLTRITAIQQLLRVRRDGLENPFPEQTSLEAVEGTACTYACCLWCK